MQKIVELQLYNNVSFNYALIVYYWMLFCDFDYTWGHRIELKLAIGVWWRYIPAFYWLAYADIRHDGENLNGQTFILTLKENKYLNYKLSWP